MKKHDFYSILGLSKGASKDDIKSAYRRMAKKYHPDHNKSKNASEKFKEVTEAYNTLIDDDKKYQYDNYGTSGSSSASQWYGRQSASDFWDFLRNPFSQQHNHTSYRQHSVVIELSLEESALGCERTVTYKTKNICSDCNGEGGAKFQCSACSGSGRKQMNSKSTNSYYSSYTILCGNCGGSGAVLAHKCNKCSGLGHITNTKNINFKIPAGVKIGHRITIHSSQNDILIGLISIIPHHRFEQINLCDLKCSETIDLPTACLGGQIEVVDLYNQKVLVNIRPGVQHGEVVVVTGHGLPTDENSPYKGALHVAVNIVIPQDLTEEMKKTVEKLRKQLETHIH